MSDKPIIAVTRTIPGQLDVPGAVVRVRGDDYPSRPELLEFVKGATGIVSMYTDKIDDELLDAAGPSLRVVSNFAVGFDNIDVQACHARDVIVTNTPDAVTEGTADMAWLLIMAVARKLIEADRYARSSDYPTNGQLGMNEFLGCDLTGRTLLIVGAGRIGRAVAQRSLGWGMRVLYVARSQHLEFEMAPLAATRVSLEQGLAAADVVSVHVPLTRLTRHLIDAKALSLMKSSAILVNTARGPVVDEGALVSALREGRLFGAGLDVYENEPHLEPGLAELTNVVLTPHIGSAEARFRLMMTAMCSENITEVLAGRDPLTPVLV